MPRYPSTNLIRFLVTKWPFSTTPLANIQQLMNELPPDSWSSFDRSEIDRDLAATITAVGGTSRVCDVAKPTVVCIFGVGQDGKSTLANMLSQGSIPIVRTDSFFAKLLTNRHGSAELLSLAEQYTTHHIDQFIGHIQQNPTLANEYVQLFFDPTIGFNGSGPVSIIEGMVFHPEFKCAVRIDHEIRNELMKRGYKIWTTRRNRE
jgi:hypothetical protein